MKCRKLQRVIKLTSNFNLVTPLGALVTMISYWVIR